MAEAPLQQMLRARIGGEEGGFPDFFEGRARNGRAELDCLLLVDVLGLDACLCEPNGPLTILRQKLAAEPQIHGGKKTRVVFTADGEDSAEHNDR